MLRSFAYTSMSVLALLTLGCSFTPKEGAGTGTTGPGPGGGSDAAPNLDRGFINQDTSGVTSGETCPSNNFTANNLPPDLLIVLDRSGSMLEDNMGNMCQGGCGAMSKWAQMTSAINQVVGTTETKVRWGLKFFASAGGSGSCNVNATAEVPVGLMNAGAIAAAIAGNMPGSSTPTRAAETQAAVYLRGVNELNPKYILLATDGLPNCRGNSSGAADDPAAIQAVADVAAMGIPTFVIGIATNGTADGTLNMMATNGGHPRTGMTPLYYPVASAADLAGALAIIQGMVALPCQFQLAGVPSNLGAVSVTVGGQAVSSTDWMYGTGNRSIVFPDNGTICMGLKAGTLKDVLINLPCGEMLIP